jgi:hypothetical protein
MRNVLCEFESDGLADVAGGSRDDGGAALWEFYPKGVMEAKYSHTR